ncbi:unnamed protein product [Somion occarium]|uniref:Uncharacterized protein n=1 Tax=Somion occarium TaxID=3059160 RepID=A0ABP1CSM1_9APHY
MISGLPLCRCGISETHVPQDSVGYKYPTSRMRPSTSWTRKYESVGYCILHITRLGKNLTLSADPSMKMHSLSKFSSVLLIFTSSLALPIGSCNGLEKRAVDTHERSILQPQVDIDKRFFMDFSKWLKSFEFLEPGSVMTMDALEPKTKHIEPSASPPQRAEPIFLCCSDFHDSFQTKS